MPAIPSCWGPASPKDGHVRCDMASVDIQVAERVARICSEHDDALALRIALVSELRRSVPFDAFAWLLTDPETEVGAAPLADVPWPWLSDLPMQIKLKYLTSVNRWTHMETPVALLRETTSDHREHSLVWRDLLAAHDVGDTASVVFRDQYGCWAFLELWRSGPTSRFTPAEAKFLSGVSGVITHALRRCQARLFEMVASEPGNRSGPVVLVLTPDLEVSAQTPETERYLALLVPPDPGRHPVPAGAYNVAAQLLATEAGVDHHPPTARVHLTQGVWLTLRASRIGELVPVTDRDIAVTIESTSPAERLELYIRVCGLSSREAELLTHLATGADTRTIACAMYLSEHTIQDHLKSIFAKCHVRNRRTLLTRALGR